MLISLVRNIRTAGLLISLLVLSLGVFACTAAPGPAEAPTSPPEPTAEMPTSPPEATSEPTDTPTPDVVYEGISFSYDASLAADVRAETISAEGAGQDGPWWLPVPEHVQFTFTGYVLSDTRHESQIFIYPAAEFEAANEFAAGIIADLRQLLADKPSAAPDGLPFLPLWNAAQLMRSNIHYLDFPNGTGVRFLTQYAQDIWPINNNGLFYTFQGLTHDGEYYLSAIFPVSNPILPADGSEIPGGDYEAFESNYDEYLRDIEQQLSAQTVSSFTPDLSVLDAMIQSILVE